jgi:hypothetical protein
MKKVTVQKDKQQKALEYLKNHPNKLLSSHANKLTGGGGPLDPIYNKGLTGFWEPPTPVEF